MTQILKYWIRLEASEDTLLIATKRSIEEQNKKGNQNWKKIVDYILKFLKIDQKPSTNAAVNGKLISASKISIKKQYVEWWHSKMQPRDSTKYDFFYKYNKQ